MGRRRRDDVDVACEEWAKPRRRMMGLEEFRTAREIMGAIRSTLGQRRDLHAGAKTNGVVVQEFPELYITHTQREVNAAYWASPPDLKDVMDVHYVARGPLDFKAEALAMSQPTYSSRVREVRAFVRAWLAKS